MKDRDQKQLASSQVAEIARHFGHRALQTSSLAPDIIALSIWNLNQGLILYKSLHRTFHMADVSRLTDSKQENFHGKYLFCLCASEVEIKLSKEHLLQTGEIQFLKKNFKLHSTSKSIYSSFPAFTHTNKGKE